MQNAAKNSNSFASATNASEFCMMMNAYVLPEFMRLSLGGEDLSDSNKDVWDNQCKFYYEVVMKSPAHLSWLDILIPFGISLDFAPIHITYRRQAVVPWVTRQEEYRTYFENAVIGLNFNLQDHLSNAFDAVIVHKQTKLQRRTGVANRDVRKKLKASIDILQGMKSTHTCAISFYVHAQFRRFNGAVQKSLALEVLQQLMLPHDEAEATFKRQHGHFWSSLFRRQQALIDRRWLCFRPEQIMPLGKATPDLHQPAEMLVARGKYSMESWASQLDPRNKKALLSANYEAALSEGVKKRNDGTAARQDRDAIRRSVHKAYKAAQIVAADLGHAFHPLKAPNPETGQTNQHHELCMGTGGRFPRKGDS